MSTSDFVSTLSAMHLLCSIIAQPQWLKQERKQHCQATGLEYASCWGVSLSLQGLDSLAMLGTSVAAGLVAPSVVTSATSCRTKGLNCANITTVPHKQLLIRCNAGSNQTSSDLVAASALPLQQQSLLGIWKHNMPRRSQRQELPPQAQHQDAPLHLLQHKVGSGNPGHARRRS